MANQLGNIRLNEIEQVFLRGISMNLCELQSLTERTQSPKLIWQLNTSCDLHPAPKALVCIEYLYFITYQHDRQCLGISFCCSQELKQADIQLFDPDKTVIKLSEVTF